MSGNRRTAEITFPPSFCILLTVVSYFFSPALTAVFTPLMLTQYHQLLWNPSLLFCQLFVFPASLSGQHHQQWGRLETGCEAQLVHMMVMVFFCNIMCNVGIEIYS